MCGCPTALVRSSLAKRARLLLHHQPLIFNLPSSQLLFFFPTCLTAAVRSVEHFCGVVGAVTFSRPIAVNGVNQRRRKRRKSGRMEKWERKKERVNQRVTAAADAVVGWQGGKVLVEGRGKKRRRKRQKRQKLRGQELKGKERKEQVVVVVVRLMVMAMVMATANHWSTGRFRTVDMGRGGRQSAEMEEDCCCCCCCCFCHRFPNHCHWASETRRHR